MSLEPIKFEDGVAYERMMVVWSQLVGSKISQLDVAPKGTALD